MQFADVIDITEDNDNYNDASRKQLFEFQLDWTDEEVRQPLDTATNDDNQSSGSNWYDAENQLGRPTISPLLSVSCVLPPLPRLREFTEADYRAAEKYYQETMSTAELHKSRREQERRQRQLAETIELD